MPRHRRLLPLRGPPEHTASMARALTAGLGPDRVLALDRAADAARWLGTSWDAVILDLHAGLDPDLLGRAHGLVRGGGGLILRLPPQLTAVRRAGLAVHPWPRSAVGARMAARLEASLADWPDDLRPLVPTEPHNAGTPGQAQVVRALHAAWTSPSPTRTALLADRGRGKSAALGLALATLAPGLRVAVAAASEDGLTEVLRFAGPLRPADLHQLAWGSERYDLVILDEAARLPVPLLQRIYARHPGAHQVWASTTGGYEGTGRGFALRFLTQVGAREPLQQLTLTEPIRWGAGDPVEAWVRELLLLDAEPAPAARARAPAPLQLRTLEPDALAADPRRLAELFGLLVHAHYRTTPGDLERLLDAPNLSVVAALRGERAVGVCLVAAEGGLPLALSQDLCSGKQRIRGHALADTLVSHAGLAEAGALAIRRSVRIAVHPAARREGIGRALAEQAHATWTPDLFGTVFGATPELLRFRRDQGYELVRVGVSRGSRTGEPAAVMIRPVSPAAHALLDRLRADLAQDLPTQLALLAVDGELPPDPALLDAFTRGLPTPAPRDGAARLAAIEGYARGPRPYDAVAASVEALLAEQPQLLGALTPAERALIVGRVLDRRPWSALAQDLGLHGVPATMRALRRAVRALLDVLDHGPKADLAQDTG